MKKLIVLIAVVGLMVMACEKKMPTTATTTTDDDTTNTGGSVAVPAWTLEVTPTGGDTMTITADNKFTMGSKKTTIKPSETILLKTLLDNGKILEQTNVSVGAASLGQANASIGTSTLCATESVGYAVKYTYGSASKSFTIAANSACIMPKGLELVIYQVNDLRGQYFSAQ